jgi:hypothetical protein
LFFGASSENGGYGPPYFKIGRSVRYSRRQLREWLAARQHQHTAEYAKKLTRFGPGLKDEAAAKEDTA